MWLARHLEVRADARVSRFMHVFDVGLVDQQVWRAIAIELEATLVIPLDHAVENFAVLQHDGHRRLGLHLFEVVKILRVGLIRRHDLFRAGIFPGRRSALSRRARFFHVCEGWADETAIPGFQGWGS